VLRERKTDDRIPAENERGKNRKIMGKRVFSSM
jgi:hypothetical protein